MSHRMLAPTLAAVLLAAAPALAQTGSLPGVRTTTPQPLSPSTTPTTPLGPSAPVGARTTIDPRTGLSTTQTPIDPRTGLPSGAPTDPRTGLPSSLPTGQLSDVPSTPSSTLPSLTPGGTLSTAPVPSPVPRSNLTRPSPAAGQPITPSTVDPRTGLPR